MLLRSVLFVQFLVLASTWQDLALQRFTGSQPILAADDHELSRLAKQHGNPWLMFEPEEVQLRGNWHARVYLQPETAASQVRRGRVLFFSARMPPGQVEGKTWQVRVSAYAYVPAATHGRFSRTSQDLPFVEEHRLPDADLLSLVTFVRSSPSAPERSNPTGPLYPIDGSMPIRLIRLGEGGDIEVVVMRDSSANWILTVRREADRWRAVGVSFVVA